jgi:hypothetical protein
VGGGSLVVTGVQEVTANLQPNQATDFPNEVLMAFDSLAAHTLMLKESSQAFGVSSTEYQAFLRIMKKIAIYRGWIAPNYWILDQASQKLKETA